MLNFYEQPKVNSPMATFNKRIISLDFDGVIHSYTSGWKGPRTIPDPPVPGAFAFILDAIDAGYEVGIHSSRCCFLFGVTAMRNWIRKHAEEEVAVLIIQDVKFYRWKPPAFLTIDDRAMQFTGKFPPVVSLKSFRPWNGQPR